MDSKVWKVLSVCLLGLAAAAVTLRSGVRLVRKETATATARRTFVFVGDSITEYAFNTSHDGFVAVIADRYGRRIDVYNRGYAGYNTRMVSKYVDEVLDGLPRRVDLFVLCLGANDARLPDAPKPNAHVPLEEYRHNLGEIVTRLQRRGSGHIVVMTPPNVDPARSPVRRSEFTRTYVDAAEQVARDSRVPSIRLFDITDNDSLRDGVHLNSKGNRAVADSLLRLIEQQLPHLSARALPPQLPEYFQLLPSP
mmetsp:Transcript_2980/g.9124  ORF Transcript_2980/g.9124 Transcript_2980/m.9124 type:complete len:252 (+) Transcript_2980:62-817(+)